MAQILDRDKENETAIEKYLDVSIKQLEDYSCQKKLIMIIQMQGFLKMLKTENQSLRYQNEQLAFGSSRRLATTTTTKPIIASASPTIKRGPGRPPTYVTYQEAKEYAQQLGLTKRKEWREYGKAGKLPRNIPINPDFVYGRKGLWENWGKFLGYIAETFEEKQKKAAGATAGLYEKLSGEKQTE